MRIMLAPMEGVVDYEMRCLLTQLGGFDRCVTEFVRVNNQLLPEKVFLKFAPELKQGGTTPSGVPVYLQLLGGNPKYMGLNAQRAAKLKPLGIDLNFGCPSKTVNNSDGGSALLREPNRIGDIVTAVRDSVDDSIPVTAKVRLGFSNNELLEDVIGNIIEAGATEICIHARTREDRYKPPAYWSAVNKITKTSPIPIIINGEIWTIEDAKRARDESGCTDLMLGRGALARPDLAACIKTSEQSIDYKFKGWNETLQTITEYLLLTENKHPDFVSNRAKQWLIFLQRQFPEALELFHRIKRIRDAKAVFEAIEASYSSSYTAI